MWRPAEYVLAVLLVFALLAWGVLGLFWLVGGLC